MILALAVFALSASIGASNVRAAEVPGFEREVRLMAREQPVDLFLEELFGKIGVPVRIDPDIVGTVNGDFAKSARDVFEDIVSSFQLTLYYDGAVASVYPASATTRSIVHLPEALGERVVDSARRMAMTDTRNHLEISEMGLVVTGTERFVEQVEELAEAVRRRGGGTSAATSDVRRAAAPAALPEDSVYRVFRLRYAWAADTTLVVGGQEVMVPGVASLLRALVGPGGMTVMPTVSRRQLERSVPGLRGEGLQSVGRGGQGGDDAASGEVDFTTPSAVTGAGSADARIVADSMQNAVVIRDLPGRMAGYESLIASLDTEPRMIEIEATIIDLDTDRLRDLGVDLRFDRGDASALSNGGIAPDADRVDGARGGIVSLVLGDERRFLSRIRALESQGAARVVSKPHVMTLANVEAVLDTSSTFFVRIEGQEEVDLFNVSVGTTLRVTPHVFEAGGRTQIKLMVSIEDGSRTGDNVDRIPVIRNSSINTQALIDGGQSLLIGGLVRESDGSTVSKVPLLGDIPGLGALFRSTSKSSNRVERLFLISPRLSVRTPAGPRHSAPVLWGDESEILATAPVRTHAALDGLARRDETFPLREPLPGGGANVALIPNGYEPSPREPRSPESGERSLRERLLGLPRGGAPSLQDAGGPTERATPVPWSEIPSRDFEQTRVRTTLPAPRAPSDPSLDDGWQAVPGTSTETATAAGDARGSGASTSGGDASGALDDGWQRVD